MSNRSDAELVEIVTRQRDDYTTAALAAAERELRSRALPVEEFRQVAEEVSRVGDQRSQVAEQPLLLIEKAVVFLLPVVTVLLILIKLNEGHTRAAGQVAKWGIAGVFFYVTLTYLLG